MDFLKKILFQRYISKHFHHVEYITWDKVHSILLLFDFEDITLPEVEKLVSKLSAEGKQVEAFYYVGKQIENTIGANGVYFISPKDISIFGKPKAGLSIEGKKVDIVIDLSFHKKWVFYYIIASVISKMICGSMNEENNLITYDFSISLNEQNIRKPDFLLEQIVKYLKMIKSE